MTEHAVDVLAVGPHPDDVELLCGGTLARCADQGYRTGILDLTRGETGTRGNAELRAAEAQIAAGILGVSVRLNAGLPDAAIENSRTASGEDGSTLASPASGRGSGTWPASSAVRTRPLIAKGAFAKSGTSISWCTDPTRPLPSSRPATRSW